MNARNENGQNHVDKTTITNIWRRRVQNFWTELTENTRASNMIRKMKPAPNRHDAAIKAILSLDEADHAVLASEKLLDYMLSEEGLDTGRVADRWMAFDRALKEAHPLLYDIVNGQFDAAVQEQQKQVVRRCLADICQAVNADDLFESLASQNLLGDLEFDTLNLGGEEEKGEAERVSYMVTHLHRSANRSWYDDFVEVLCQAGHESLVEKMNDTYDDIFRKSNPKPGLSPLAQVPDQTANALCRDFQSKLSVQSTSATTPKVQCFTCMEVFHPSAGHQCRKPSASGSATQYQTSAAKTSYVQNEAAYSGHGKNSAVEGRPIQNSATATSPNWFAQPPPYNARPQEQQCPGCGKLFKQLSRHKCKVLAVQPGTSGVPKPPPGAAHWSTLPTMSHVEGQQCPTCGKIFKQLSRHKCKGLQGNPQSLTTVRQRVLTASISFTSSERATSWAGPASQGQQPCPTCGKMFKRLSMHKCKGPFY